MIAPVPVLAGPTASGKTGISLLVAPALNAEIVSVDSRQIYRGMTVGSAAPTAGELEQVPHHLVEEVDAGAIMTAGEYGRRVRERVASIRDRGKEALLVGGAGLYLRAALGGLDPEMPHEPEVRDRLKRRAEDEGDAALHAELGRVDPVTAAETSPRDRQRVLRALEIAQVTGQRPSDLRRSGRETRVPARMVVLAWDRTVLEERIRRRTALMIEGGLEDEVRALLDRGIDRTAACFRSVGYAETLRYLDGELDRAGWEEQIVIHTRRYAKKQRTWFRSIPDAVWVQVTEADAPRAVAGEVLRVLAELSAGDGAGKPDG